jgi:hypothetical protein
MHDVIRDYLREQLGTIRLAQLNRASPKVHERARNVTSQHFSWSQQE